MPFLPDDTIVAVATAPGHAALGVVRLSGPQAIAVTDRVFRAADKRPFLSAPSHTLLHGSLYDNDTRIDEVMVVALRAPHSYTGEDIVEISAHGGPVILHRIVELFLARGARHAAAGEFTFRAFVNGKMDLARAEAVADLIQSKTEHAAQASLDQLAGKLSARIKAFRTQLTELLARIEVALDYAEEDIRFISHAELAGKLRQLEEDVAQLKKTADKGKFLRDGLKAAIIGRPNSGKSSLLNALLERERAIVTDIPGTTRDILEETLDVRGIPVVIIDTAGLRAHTLDPVEKIGQERTLDSLRNADIVLWLVDASAPLSPEDRHIARLIEEHNKISATIVLFNKSDRPATAGFNEEFNSVFPGNPLPISALTRQGLDCLEATIFNIANVAPLPDGALVVNLRHRDALDRTEKTLHEAQQALTEGKTEEIIAFHLREALNALGEITGETTTEEILDTIFSRFCVGK